MIVFSPESAPAPPLKLLPTMTFSTYPRVLTCLFQSHRIKFMYIISWGFFLLGFLSKRLEKQNFRLPLTPNFLPTWNSKLHSHTKQFNWVQLLLLPPAFLSHLDWGSHWVTPFILPPHPKICWRITFSWTPFTLFWSKSGFYLFSGIGSHTQMCSESVPCDAGNRPWVNKANTLNPMLCPWSLYLSKLMCMNRSWISGARIY